MNCYLCDQTPPVGRLRYGIQSAVGVCKVCGIGVCREHSYKAGILGSPLLCVDCAKLQSNIVTASPGFALENVE